MNSIFGDGSQPANVIWVDASAGEGGTGSAENPFSTIQQAVKMAKPGTAIMVREGDYHENVKFPRDVSGTEDAPIWLISADGPQKAHIFAVDQNKSAIVGGGVENVIVDGFWVTGGKNGIQFSQNGFDFTDMIRNITVRNNVIDGIVEDGIKMNGGNNILVENNIITGGKDEGIDYVAIVDGVIRHNEVSGNTGTSAGIYAKGGSANIQIVGNHVHDVTGDGIAAGGWMNFDLAMRSGYEAFQANNILIEGNRIEDVGKRPLSFFGAGNAVATNNYLEATEKYYTAIYVGDSNETRYGVHHSANISIVDNFITRETRVLYITEGSGGVTYDNNRDMTVSVEDAGARIAGRDQSGPGKIPLPDDLAAIKLVPLTRFLKESWEESATPGAAIRDGKGTDGADLLNRKAATLEGGAGDDTYLVGNGDGIVERAGGGTDTLQGQSRYVALPDEVENLTLVNKQGAVGIGSAGDNAIAGGVGDDILVGGGGNNRLTGGAGEDMFIVGTSDLVTRITDFTPGDLIHIDANPFASFVDLQAALHQVGQHSVLVLSPGRAIIFDNVVAKSLTAADFDFAGGGAAQDVKSATDKIKANSSTHLAEGDNGADLLYGTGDAILKGGAGNDNYIIKQAGDHIVEHAGGGVDTVLLFGASYVMEANVDNVKAKVDSPITVLGNNLANFIIGGAGDDVIAGGAGVDQLIGGKGADSFVFNALGDGGDLIQGFELGIDKLDFRPLAAAHSDLNIVTRLSDNGLAVYVEHGGVETLMATLTNVIAPVDPGVLLI